MNEKDDGSDIPFGTILILAAAIVVSGLTCSTIMSLHCSIDKLKECAEHIEVKDQTTRETISRLQDTLVRLEAVREARKEKTDE